MSRERRTIYKWDIDKTLCEEVCFDEKQCLAATPIPQNVRKIRKHFEDGFVIIETARKDDLMSATFLWLKKHAIPFHAVSNWKIPGDVYVDVDAITPDDI